MKRVITLLLSLLLALSLFGCNTGAATRRVRYAPYPTARTYTTTRRAAAPRTATRRAATPRTTAAARRQTTARGVPPAARARRVIPGLPGTNNGALPNAAYPFPNTAYPNSAYPNASYPNGAFPYNPAPNGVNAGVAGVPLY